MNVTLQPHSEYIGVIRTPALNGLTCPCFHIARFDLISCRIRVGNVLSCCLNCVGYRRWSVVKYKIEFS